MELATCECQIEPCGDASGILARNTSKNIQRLTVVAEGELCRREIDLHDIIVGSETPRFFQTLRAESKLLSSRSASPLA